MSTLQTCGEDLRTVCQHALGIFLFALHPPEWVNRLEGRIWHFLDFLWCRKSDGCGCWRQSISPVPGVNKRAVSGATRSIVWSDKVFLINGQQWRGVFCSKQEIESNFTMKSPEINPSKTAWGHFFCSLVCTSKQNLTNRITNVVISSKLWIFYAICIFGALTSFTTNNSSY